LSASDRDPLELARATLAGTRAWLVGGAVRDRLRGQARALDLDIVVDGEPREVARALARAASEERATAFALSEEWGGWRVVSQAGGWQIDVERLRGGTLEEDLALRDFTVNAIAEPLGEPAGNPGRLIDPLGGQGDLAGRCLRAAGPRAFAEDPRRVLRLVRLAVELGLEPTPQTAADAAAHAGGLRSVSPERVFMELRRILAASRARDGIELMGSVGATAVVLPELDALRGVQQSRFHHLDVYEHTLEVLDRTVALSADPLATAPAAVAAEHVPQLTALLAEPLADELTRAEALRWGALLHDIAKPPTRAVSADTDRAGEPRVTFIGHDRLGAELARDILARLRASSRLRTHVAALVLNHLRLGFLVHQPQPLSRRTVFAYLRACEPVEVDVTILSVADRLATRGARAQEAIDAHLRLAGAILGDALRWHAGGPPEALLRGDELARELGLDHGPRLGELLEELTQARYAGEIATPGEALAHARSVLDRDRDRAPKMGRA
jgi:putative nucleotidyltransferase with HDIG domain